MKIQTPHIFLCIFLIWPTIALSETPKQMLRNVYTLTEGSALLNVCFESSKYKELSNEEALELAELESRISKIVEMISEHYNDNSLMLTYEISRVDISSDLEMRKYSQDRYDYCGENLFVDMRGFVSENEKLIGSYLARSNTQNKTPWPKEAKAAYIERCTSSLASQGLQEDQAKMNCSCVATGMENEFGMEEYEAMMRAQPNPAGNEIDQRLFGVIKSCQ